TDFGYRAGADARHARGDLVRLQAGGVDDEAGVESRFLSAPGADEDAVIVDPAAGERRVEGEHRAVAFRLALQGQHQGVAVDDAGRWRQQRAEAGKLRFQLRHFRRVDPAQIVDAVFRAMARDAVERIELRRRGGDD